MASQVTLDGKLMFPSDYVAAVEFMGRDVTLTISGVKIEDLAIAGTSQKKRKPVISFKERPKKLVLNKTNAESIAAVHGREAKLWVGKRITLYPTRTRYGSNMVDCIRVRENGHATAQSPAGILGEPPPGDQDETLTVNNVGYEPDALGQLTEDQLLERLKSLQAEKQRQTESAPAPMVDPATEAEGQPAAPGVDADSQTIPEHLSSYSDFYAWVEKITQDRGASMELMTTCIGKWLIAIGKKGKTPKITQEEFATAAKLVLEGRGNFAGLKAKERWQT
jgi:hypothetical protein